MIKDGDPRESRTPDWGVRGPRLDHLTIGPRRVSTLPGEPQGSPESVHGTPSGTRTLDTLIKSQVLYQLS